MRILRISNSYGKKKKKKILLSSIVRKILQYVLLSFLSIIPFHKIIQNTIT